MKQLLTKLILISILSSFVFANPVSSFSISPVFANFEGENGVGIGIGFSVNKYIVSSKIINNNFKQKEVEITTPYHIFYKYSYINLNNKKHNYNYFGIYYSKLINFNQNEDVNVKNDLLGKFSLGISPKGHKYAQLQYILSHHIKKHLFANATFAFSRYFSVWNEFEASLGLEKDF